MHVKIMCLFRFYASMALRSPIRTSTTRQGKSSIKAKLWARRDPSPNLPPRKSLCWTVSGETFSTQHFKVRAVRVFREKYALRCWWNSVYCSLASVRTALSEKKTVLKPKSPEKSRPDEKDVEKSPAKKTEGWQESHTPIYTLADGWFAKCFA